MVRTASGQLLCVYRTDGGDGAHWCTRPLASDVSRWAALLTPMALCSSEAPLMFRRGDLYYAAFGHACCCNFQYWGALSFGRDARVLPLEWAQSWELPL